MKIIAGLGNPGAEYERTRHNIGFMVLEMLAREFGVAFRQGPECLFAEFVCGEEKGILVKPMTFMNLSGNALGAVLDEMEEEPPLSDILVITDDINLSLGRLRFRAGGSCGGHNGLASIETALASKDYPRLRFGVGGPREGEGLIDFVLSPFGGNEEKDLLEILPVASRAVCDWIREGTESCQSRYNGWVFADDTAPDGGGEAVRENARPDECE